MAKVSCPVCSEEKYVSFYIDDNILIPCYNCNKKTPFGLWNFVTWKKETKYKEIKYFDFALKEGCPSFFNTSEEYNKMVDDVCKKCKKNKLDALERYEEQYRKVMLEFRQTEE